MAYIDPAQTNDPHSSPSSGAGRVLDALLPVALATLAIDGPSETLAKLKAGIRGFAKRDPIDALFATVVGGGIAFYMAERETNPACKTPWDGILYMATALSVGYDNLFPTTAAGHALASLVQTFGPAMANSAFDPPAAETQAAADESAAVNRAILERLDAIVRLLEARS